jgi:hypothetical protein
MDNLPPINSNGQVVPSVVSSFHPLPLDPKTTILEGTAQFPCSSNPTSIADYLCRFAYYGKLYSVNVAAFIIIMIGLYLVFQDSANIAIERGSKIAELAAV